MGKEVPLVSVLIPFRRNDDFLLQAISSITMQQYVDLEILLLDNRVLESKQDIEYNDARIRIVNCQGITTLSRVLNRGISLSEGAYIARMDADDLSSPLRISKQVDFMQLNDKIGILGSAIELITADGNVVGKRSQPKQHEGIISKLENNNPFFHPTIMFRASIIRELRGPYNPRYVRAQDYELWTRLLRITKGANLNDTLVKYRLHENQAGKDVPYQSQFYFHSAQLKYSVKNFSSQDKRVNVKRTFTILSKFIFTGIKYLKKRVQIKLLVFKFKSN